MEHRGWRTVALLAALASVSCAGPAVRQAEAPAAVPATATATATATAARAADASQTPAASPDLPAAGIAKGVAPSAGAEELAKARKAYEEGAYAAAAKRFQAALDLGLATGDEVNAHKHLAFIACATNRRTQCRAEFRKALDIDPAFDLTPAEAGHPLWGPTFRLVKRQVQPSSAAKGRNG